MTYAWEDLEGVCLAGEYGLDQWLGSEPSGAFFLTSFGAQRRRAVLKVVLEDPATAGAQLRLWRRAARLTHPSLMALLDCGRTDHGDGSFLFAVFEAPDDSLTAALRNGPMSEEEARDVLAAALDALHYLHTRGWAHTSIDTEHVVAVGDRIKLASDTLWDGADNQSAQSEDVWALGALLYELVTARRIESGDVPDLSGISDPLRMMIQHAIEPDVHYRWTAAQMVEALGCGGAGDAAVDVETGPEELCRVDEEPLVPESAAAERSHGDALVIHMPPGNSPSVDMSIVRREDATASKAPPGTGPGAHAKSVETSLDAADTSVRATITRYVPVAAAVAVAVLAIVFAIAHHAAPEPPAVAIVPPPVAEPAPAVIPVSVPKQPASAPKQPLSSWRVIAYTYARHQDAEKKVQSINTRFSGIHAEVFPVGSSYLVSLGAHLTREQAASLQRKAIAKGLPRDTYIQNFRSEE